MKLMLPIMLKTELQQRMLEMIIPRLNTSQGMCLSDTTNTSYATTAHHCHSLVIPI